MLTNTRLNTVLLNDDAEPELVTHDTTASPDQKRVTSSNGSDLPNANINRYVTKESSKNSLIETIVYCQNFNRMRSAYKINEIQNKISGCVYDIIVGTETSWSENIKSEEVFGSKYNVFRCDRDLSLTDKKSGGGVLVAVNASMQAEQISSATHEEFEDVWVKILINGEIHLFVSVYFPPHFAKKPSYETFFEIAESMFSSLPLQTKIHIYGDFNQKTIDFILCEDNDLLLPIVGENETLQFIFDRTSQLGLHQVNHVRNQLNCYLDFMFTNCTEDFNIDEAADPLWKNEIFHTAIEYSLFTDSQRLRPDDNDFELVYDFKSINYLNFHNRLNGINWQNLLNQERDINKAVDIFFDIVNDIIDELVPKRKRKIMAVFKNPIWYTQKIKNLKNRKQKAHKNVKSSKTEHNLEKYIEICRALDAEISSAYESYNLRVENNIKSDPKVFFNFAKGKLKSNNLPSRMQFEDFDSDDSGDICNQFARFFQNIYKNSDGSLDSNYFSYLPEHANDVSVENITVQEIFQALDSLDVSKGHGPDGIPPVLLKNLATAFVKPLFWLFNLSLNSGNFPLIWKKSYLIPIFKSGKRSDIKNYRGVAIISCIPKVFEAIVNQKMFNQVKQRISNNQHGFFKGRSTCTNLLEFVNFSLAAMDRGNSVETLYTDFSKAFDRVDIPLLLFKLKRIGLAGTLLKWIESYLTDRTQIVRFKGRTSTPIKVTSGVPQGSHLGPLLFILFVDDVKLVLNRLNVLTYADDMKLYMEICNELDLRIFQNEVDVFYNWCEKSLLDINVKKCNIITYTRKHATDNFNCNLGNQVVERSNKVKDLGVILDSKLTFVDHLNITINKANNMLSFIKRFSFHFKDPYTIKTLYVSYVRSILEYCCVVWAPYQETYINRLESVQKQFLLFALRKLGWNSFPLPSYESRCLLINIETLKKRREIAMIIFVTDIISQAQIQKIYWQV